MDVEFLKQFIKEDLKQLNKRESNLNYNIGDMLRYFLKYIEEVEQVINPTCEDFSAAKMLEKTEEVLGEQYKEEIDIIVKEIVEEVAKGNGSLKFVNMSLYAKDWLRKRGYELYNNLEETRVIWRR